MNEAYQILAITFTAVFGIAILKLLMGKFPIPGLKDVVALA